MKFQDEQSIKDVINSIVDQSKLRPKLLEAELVRRWPEIVGEPIARYTDSVVVRRGVLTLTISSPALRNELGFQRKALKDLLNRELNFDFIEDVVVR